MRGKWRKSIIWILAIVMIIGTLPAYAGEQDAESIVISEEESIEPSAVISDTTGPTVSDVRLEEQGQTLHPGDTAHFSFKAYDESGIRDDIYGVLFIGENDLKITTVNNWYYDTATDRYKLD